MGQMSDGTTTDPAAEDQFVPDPVIPEAVIADPSIDPVAEYEAKLEAELPAPGKKPKVRKSSSVGPDRCARGFGLDPRVTFEDLDFDAIVDRSSLEDADLIALSAMWVIWIASQGVLTGFAAARTARSPRGGGLPRSGRSDVGCPGAERSPVPAQDVHRMGPFPDRCHAPVAAGSVFSIGGNSCSRSSRRWGLLVLGADRGHAEDRRRDRGSSASASSPVAVVVASEKRTAKIGRIIAPVHGFVLRLLRKPDPPDLAETLTAARADRSATTRPMDDRHVGHRVDRDHRFALLLAIRFTGTPDSVIGWPEIFLVYAVVQGLTVLPITAGDAGVSEIAYIGLLSAAAGPEYVNARSPPVSSSSGIRTWVVIIPIGLTTLGLWQRLMARSKQKAAAAETATDPAATS